MDGWCRNERRAVHVSHQPNSSSSVRDLQSKECGVSRFRRLFWSLDTRSYLRYNLQWPLISAAHLPSICRVVILNSVGGCSDFENNATKQDKARFDSRDLWRELLANQRLAFHCLRGILSAIQGRARLFHNLWSCNGDQVEDHHPSLNVVQILEKERHNKAASKNTFSLRARFYLRPAIQWRNRWPVPAAIMSLIIIWWIRRWPFTLKLAISTLLY